MVSRELSKSSRVGSSPTAPARLIYSNFYSSFFYSIIFAGDFMEKVVIVGGGASGIVAGIFSKRIDNEVIILEKNSKPLKKLLITGNGRCNFFNDDFNVSHYYSDNIDDLSNIINVHNKSRIIKDFLLNIGVVARIRNGYYYPNSNQSYSVHNSLLKEASVRGVKVIGDTKVLNIVKDNNKFIIDTNNGRYVCDKVVVSTGSCAYPKTGSEGDGYLFGKSFGHGIIPVYPALVQLVSDSRFIRDLSGVRSDVKVSLCSNDNVVKSDIGEIQFTDYGLSGICIYNLSILVNKLLSEGKDVSVKVNFFNDFELYDVLSFINWFDKQNSIVVNRTITELLEGYLNYKVVNVILKLCGIDYDSSWNEISFKKKQLLAQYLVSFKVNIVGTKGFESAQVCVGGISIEDIDIATFESKIVPGLYFTGEVLDVTGDCGGYNLGFAFLSGMLAGEAIGGKND